MFSSYISEKSLKKGVSVILRLPALFILDWWFRTDPKPMVHVTSETVVYYLVFLLAVTLEILPLVKLVTVYMSAVSCCLLLASYVLSAIFVEREMNDSVSYNIKQLMTHHGELFGRVILLLIAQCFIAAIIAFLLGITNWSKYLLLVFTTPLFARLIGCSPDKLLDVQNYASVFTLLMIMFYLFSTLTNTLNICINRVDFDFKITSPLQVLITFWKSIFVSVQMLIFGVLTFFCRLYLHVYTYYDYRIYMYNRRIIYESWLGVSLSILKEFSTPVCLCALCVIISYTLFGVLKLTKFLFTFTSYFSAPVLANRKIK